MNAGGRLAVNVMRIGILLLIIIVWQLLSGPVLSPTIFGSPYGIYLQMINLAEGHTGLAGSLAGNFWTTFIEAVYGYVLGVVVGIPLGLVLGMNKVVARVLDPFILAVYSIPKIALAPVFVAWFGIGLWSKVAQAFILVVFLVFYNTYAGIQNANPDLVNAVRVLGASRRKIITSVLIPSSFPFIFVGLRISLPYALIGAIVGEFIASSSGLGFYINFEAGLLNTNAVFAGILIVTLIAVILDVALGQVQKRALRWQPS